jgi:hypothetical protein
VQKRLFLNRGKDRRPPRSLRSIASDELFAAGQPRLIRNSFAGPQAHGAIREARANRRRKATRQSTRRSVVHCGEKIVVEVQSCGRFFHDSRTNKVVAEVFVAAAFFCVRFKQWRQRGDNRIAIDVATM